MTAVKLTKEDFETKVINSEKTVLLDFFKYTFIAAIVFFVTENNVIYNENQHICV